MLNRRVLPDFVLLRTPPGHTATAAVAFHAIGSAVAAHARAAGIRAVAAKAISCVIAAWKRDAGAVKLIPALRSRTPLFPPMRP